MANLLELPTLSLLIIASLLGPRILGFWGPGLRGGGYRVWVFSGSGFRVTLGLELWAFGVQGLGVGGIEFRV